jgi:ubiquinone/menaquinone biosynthesis C-methylase UbiE
VSALVPIPEESVEREFLAFWAEHLLDPRDPQNARWLALEMQQIDRGAALAEELAAHVCFERARVLDVGCQTAGLAIAMARRGANVTGVDVDSTLVRSAEIRARCHGVENAAFTVAEGEMLPFPSSHFDVVTFVDVIEHVRDATAALREVARVIAPGGTLFLQGPNRWSPRWFASDPHYRMAGISILPPSLGRFYVTTLRRRPRYDVGVFPVGSRVLQSLEQLGFDIDTPRTPTSAIARMRHEIALRFGSMFVIRARKTRIAV